ncbi:MAG: glycosyl transferase [Ruminococcaceae bacterium]|nr:glycosyl transferase [Oscillospiraceae bacterium]
MKPTVKKALKFLFKKKYRQNFFAVRGFYNKMSDEKYLKMRFKTVMGKELDLENPKTFNEKLQWLKLYDRKPIYTTMVDKYAVKQYVAERIGDEYIIPTLGVWSSFDEIDFDSLPERFVLKCTHDSGGLVIVRDKAMLNREKARAKIERSLKRDYYLQSREWPYKNVPRKILAEVYMENENGVPLRDYKFYCFNGEPKFLYISEGLENHATASISFVTLDWQFAPYERSDFKPFETLPPKPEKLEDMIFLAKKLSDGCDFLRVDFYQINGNIYFSELTFFPCGGMLPFREKNHDCEIGEMLNLSK